LSAVSTKTPVPFWQCEFPFLESEVHALSPMMEQEVPVKIRQTRLLIDNEWIDAREGNSFQTLNPGTGEVIAEVAAEGSKKGTSQAL
jgi:hypothetical protein